MIIGQAKDVRCGFIKLIQREDYIFLHMTYRHVMGGAVDPVTLKFYILLERR